MVHHPTLQAYSVHFRDKIVATILQRGMSKEEAARTFGVGATSVKRYVKLQEERKPLTPGKKGKLGHSGMKLY
jgi:transposase